MLGLAFWVVLGYSACAVTPPFRLQLVTPSLQVRQELEQG